MGQDSHSFLKKTIKRGTFLIPFVAIVACVCARVCVEFASEIVLPRWDCCLRGHIGILECMPSESSYLKTSVFLPFHHKQHLLP